MSEPTWLPLQRHKDVSMCIRCQDWTGNRVNARLYLESNTTGPVVIVPLCNDCILAMLPDEPCDMAISHP